MQDSKAQINPKDLEAMVLNTARYVDGKSAELLGHLHSSGNITAEMRLTVQEQLGYERIANPSTVDEGITLLRDIYLSRKGRMFPEIDYNKILKYAYDKIVVESTQWIARKETIPQLSYAFKLIEFVKGLGRKVDLNNVWYAKTPQGEPNIMVEDRRQIPKKYQKSARSLGDLLRARIIVNFEKHDYSQYGSDEQIVKFLHNVGELGIKITPEDVVQTGYQRSLVSHGEPEGAFRLITIGERMGAAVPRVILELASHYRSLTPQREKLIGDLFPAGDGL